MPITTIIKLMMLMVTMILAVIIHGDDGEDDDDVNVQIYYRLGSRTAPNSGTSCSSYCTSTIISVTNILLLSIAVVLYWHVVEKKTHTPQNLKLTVLSNHTHVLGDSLQFYSLVTFSSEDGTLCSSQQVRAYETLQAMKTSNICTTER